MKAKFRYATLGAGFLLLGVVVFTSRTRWTPKDRNWTPRSSNTRVTMIESTLALPFEESGSATDSEEVVASEERPPESSEPEIDDDRRRAIDGWVTRARRGERPSPLSGKLSEREATYLSSRMNE